MSDLMQLRIADIVDKHTPTGAEGLLDCWCGFRSGTFWEHAEHVAALLVGELGLRMEFGATSLKWNGGRVVRATRAEAQIDLEMAVARKRYPVDDPTPVVTPDDMHIECRYVTDWQVDV